MQLHSDLVSWASSVRDGGMRSCSGGQVIFDRRTPLGCPRTALLSQSFTSRKSLLKIKMLMQAHPKHTNNSRFGNPLRQKYLGSGKALRANLTPAQPVLDAPEVAAEGPRGRQRTAQRIHQSGPPQPFPCVAMPSQNCINHVATVILLHPWTHTSF